MRQHSSATELRRSYCISGEEIPPVPALTWNDFPLSPTPQAVNRPSPFGTVSEATSSLVPLSDPEDGAQRTPVKVGHRRRRSGARTVASIAEGLRQMNPFRRGASRPNRSDNLESTPRKGSNEIPFGDNFQTPSRTQKTKEAEKLLAAEITVPPSPSNLPQTPSGNSESIMTDPPLHPYGSAAPRPAPERDSRRSENCRRPHTAFRSDALVVDHSPSKPYQSGRSPMPQQAGGQCGSTYTVGSPPIPYGSTVSKATPVSVDHSMKDNASELRQMALRPALRNPPHLSQSVPLPVLGDNIQWPVAIDPSAVPISCPVITGIRSGNGRDTVQSRHGATFSASREDTFASETFPGNATSRIKTDMSLIEKDGEGVRADSSWIPPEESSREGGTPLLPTEHYSIPMKGVSNVLEIDDSRLGKDLLQSKHAASFVTQQDVASDWEVDARRSEHNTEGVPAAVSLTDTPSPVRNGHDIGDLRSPTTKQLLMARATEIQTASDGRNRDTMSRSASTAPNYFPPSARKPLPSIPIEPQDANPSTPQRANVPARGTSTSPSQSRSTDLKSLNFSRPRPLDSRLKLLRPPNFNPSPYGILPWPSHTSTKAAGILDDPFTGNTDLESENLGGAVVIDTKPELKHFTARGSRGPSFERIIAITEKLRRGQYDNGGTKLEGVKKLIVKGLWNGVGFDSKDAEYGVEQASELQRKEEGQATELIAAVLKMMDRLQEFEWKSELPFTKALWPGMPTATITIVFIDIFRAGAGDDDETGAFLPEDLVPLRTLAALRSLTVVGMTESYQKQIWEALWLIPGVRHLDLRMTTEPALRRDRDEKWEYIEGPWKIKKFDEVALTYHGNRGSGKIHFNSGYGEYLDIMCMMKAWRAIHPDQPQRKMGLESLTLEGFIVDAQPFVKIFDESKFKRLEFVGLNMDAGLALKPAMMVGMKVIIPGESKLLQVRQMAAFYPAGSAKLITIGRKKKSKNEKLARFL
ncbi:hypothetical protein GP486_005029 [Trichoglossum hirsutum]|uniref:Uncharacterized protein n=1 Tax=Trichoglossum hirsutum TaxID=265104 RepID=A0A9P8LA61_9PEZI|nr:hypothetical protein GP486_005029 [Trichoglossum hirsutum]